MRAHVHAGADVGLALYIPLEVHEAARRAVQPHVGGAARDVGVFALEAPHGLRELVSALALLEEGPIEDVVEVGGGHDGSR